MEYAGFWRRIGAHFLDLIIFSPLFVLSIWGNFHFRLFNIYMFVPEIFISIFYNIYLVKRYGATPGKLLLKIKIAKLDGSSVGYQEAVLRQSVVFILSIIANIAILTASLNLNMTDDQYFALHWMERSHKILENASSWYKYVQIVMGIWVWGEFIVMLTNKRRRAIHDFMAGTVIIKK